MRFGCSSAVIALITVMKPIVIGADMAEDGIDAEVVAVITTSTLLLAVAAMKTMLKMRKNTKRLIRNTKRY